MRWYEYKMETDDLYAPDDLKAKLLAMTDQLTEEEKAQPMMKTDAPVPAQSAPVQPKKKLIRFPAKRVGALAACLAVCVVGYGAKRQPQRIKRCGCQPNSFAFRFFCIPMFCQFLTGFGGHFTVSAACLCSSCTKVCSSGRRVPLSG